MTLQSIGTGEETLQVVQEHPLNIGLSLKHNFSWTLAGNIVYTGCQWGMLVALAKLGTTAVVGIFALAFAVTAPVIMFAGLQLRAVQATDARRDFSFGDYLALRLATMIAAMLAIVVIIAVSGFRLEIILVTGAIALAKVFESISDIFYGLLQQHERMDRIAISMTIKGILSLFAFTITFYLTKSIVWSSVALAIAWGLVLVIYDIRSGIFILCRTHGFEGYKSALKPRWNRSILANLALLALPLGFVMLLMSLNGNIPRYFIQRYMGEGSLGVFAAVSALMVAGTTIVGALGQSASPRLSRHYAMGDRPAYISLLIKLVGVGAVLGIVGIAVAVFGGKWLLAVLYGSEYALQSDLFIWIMLAAGASYAQSFLGYGVTAARRFAIQAPLLAVVTGVTTLGCILLMPSFGIVGAGIAVFIASVVHAVGNMMITMRALSELKISEEAL